MPTETFTNVQCTYITNQPHEYFKQEWDEYENGATISTGWHVIPNQLVSHFVTPKQWYELMIKAEAIRPLKIEIDCFNLIPQTETLNIQGTTPFWGFNNCVYAISYVDDCYETDYYNWMLMDRDGTKKQHPPNTTPNLFYKEGRQINLAGNGWLQQTLPLYGWRAPLYRVHSDRTWGNFSEYSSYTTYPYKAGNAHPAKIPAGIMWDPLNRPDCIRELRPGKNNLHFEFTYPDSPMFNTDRLAYTWPYAADGPYNGNQRPNAYEQTHECDPDELASQREQDPPLNDYTMPDFENMPIVPCGWWWIELNQSIVDDASAYSMRKPNKSHPGLETQTACITAPQWFIKIMPLWRATSLGQTPTLVDCYAQMSMRSKIVYEYIPRKSAIYAPTWGPWGWLDLYSHTPWRRSFRESYIRARTSGRRRTWQNWEYTSVASHPADLGQAAYHPREDPYKENHINASGSGAGGTYTTTTSQTTIKQDTRTDTPEILSQRIQMAIQEAPQPKIRWYSKLRKDLKRTSKQAQQQSPEPMDSGHDNEAFSDDN